MSVQQSDIGLSTAGLQQPLQVGAVHLRSRIVMASLTRSRSAPTDIPNEANVKYYEQRAGAGLIMSEGTLISPQGTEWPNVPGIYSKEHVEGWKKVIDAVHKAGGTIFAQLWHVGRAAHPDMPMQKGQPVAAPSPIAARGGNFRQINNAPNATPQEHPDPSKLVEEYHQAAINAKEAGFDGVEYLPHQFLDKTSNHRTDKWGGSIENRARLYVESLAAITKVWGADRVGIKLNPCGGFNDVGMNEEDTIESFTYVIKHAVDIGLAYIQLVRYLPFMDPEFEGKQRSDTHLDVLSTFEPLIHTPSSKTKLFYNGNLSAVEAEGLLQLKKIDAVVFGRSFINNPDLVERLFEGKALNETLGHPDAMKTWYQFEDDPNKGYTDFPTYAVAAKEKEQKDKAEKKDEEKKE